MAKQGGGKLLGVSVTSLASAAISIGTAVVLSACASSYRSNSGDVAKPSLLEDAPGEVSLRADRSDLDKARRDIPEEIKKQNDEIAMMMSFVTRDGGDEDPNRLRDRFNTALRKKREAVDKKVRHAREDFTKKERADRDAFLKKSKDERDAYLASGRKRSSEDRKRFFEDQEDRRKAFFADQQEKRKDYEQHIQEERKDLEDFIREKQNAFSQELRAYQTRYNERKHQLEVKKKMEEKSRALERAGKPVQPVTHPNETEATSNSEGAMPDAAPAGAAPNMADPMAEFDKIPPGPAIPLGSGKSGP